MTVAVQTLATSEYGALNDEVKKMSDQLSWGIKFSDVILQFAERVGTPLVKRAISLISEADVLVVRFRIFLSQRPTTRVKSSSLKGNGNERLDPTLRLFGPHISFSLVLSSFFQRSLFQRLRIQIRPMKVAVAKTLET